MHVHWFIGYNRKMCLRNPHMKLHSLLESNFSLSWKNKSSFFISYVVKRISVCTHSTDLRKEVNFIGTYFQNVHFVIFTHWLCVMELYNIKHSIISKQTIVLSAMHRWSLKLRLIRKIPYILSKHYIMSLFLNYEIETSIFYIIFG